MRAVRRYWARHPRDGEWFDVIDSFDEMCGLETLRQASPGAVLIQKYDNGQVVIFTRKADK